MPHKKNPACPVCGADKTDYGKPYVSVRHHITNLAKNELFERELAADNNRPAPHMDYVKRHAQVVATTKLVIRIKGPKRGR